MSSLPTRTATFASLKCRSKWDFLSKLRKDKKKGKRAVFPYDKASSRKPCLSLSSSIVLSQQVPSDKSRQHNRVPSFPIKLQQKTLSNHKKKQTSLVCFFFLLFARCILISYSVDLSSSNPNSFSNHTN